jgi:sugar phosphate isomerase/epimerase
MQFAIPSSAFSRALDGGELTQLEFIDAVARELHCEGIVLSTRHFPRTDDDYLAQIKKMSTDLGLCIAALETPDFFASDEGEMRLQLGRALATGAPLLCTTMASETAMPWSEQLARLAIATGLAKSLNVTIAVRNAPGTFAATAHDCKRAAKEADSAWFRFALDPSAFDLASEWAPLLAKTVLGWERASGQPHIERWGDFVGFVTLADDAEATTLPEMREAARQWRTARAKHELNRI